MRQEMFPGAIILGLLPFPYPREHISRNTIRARDVPKQKRRWPRDPLARPGINRE